MMVRVDYRDEENRATVRCHLCGSVSGLVRDGDRFRCRDACPPDPPLVTGDDLPPLTRLGWA